MLLIISWAISWWCFVDTKMHTRWKMLTAWWPWAQSLQTGWSLLTDDVDSRESHLVTSLPTNQKIVCKLIIYPPPSPSFSLWKPFPENLGEVWILWAWAALSPCLALQYHSTFLHHNGVQVDWLQYRQVDPSLVQ